MNIVYILIYIVLISHTIRFSIIDFLVGFCSQLHSTCVEVAIDHVRSFESLQALVCGKNFSDPAQSNLLIASGLIHLFVVSASHLMILRKMIFYLLRNKTATFLLLFLYCAVCNFNPPIVRSFAALLILAVNEKINLKWKTENLVLVSGLICLTLSPAWINSLSLQMSWIAALTLSVISCFFTKANMIFKNSLFYFQYLATFNFIGIPHPASIGVATVFTRFLEYVLFPLALAVYLFPLLGLVFDFLIVSLNRILSKLELTVIFRPYDSEKMIFINWVLILGLHLLLNYTNQPAQRLQHV